MALAAEQRLPNWPLRGNQGGACGAAGPASAPGPAAWAARPAHARPHAGNPTGTYGPVAAMHQQAICARREPVRPPRILRPRPPALIYLDLNHYICLAGLPGRPYGVVPRAICYVNPGLRGDRGSSMSLLQEGQQVGVDGLRLRRGHAVREAAVGLQRPVLDKLCRQWSGVGVGNDLIVIAMHH
jgi:hypothetical protein